MNAPEFRYARLKPFPAYEELLQRDGREFVRAMANIPRLAQDAPIAIDRREQFSSEHIASAKVPARIYGSQNGVSEIIIPEDYAGVLDAVRERHKNGPALAQEDGRPRDDSLALHSYADRVHPVHVDYLLSRLPDSGLGIARIYILDETDPMDHWRAEVYGKPNFRATASCNLNTIWLWKLAYGNGSAGDIVNHEWGHQLQWQRTALDRLHQLAMELEPGPPEVSAEERWADLVETLLNWLHDMLVLESLECPIQTSIVGRAIGSILSETRSAGRLHGDLRTRMDRISQDVEPIACRNLEAVLGSENERRKAIATQLLHFLSRKDEARV